MDQDPSEQKRSVDFLVKDYELKINYLNAHFTRMWTRFNFFLSVETALIGGKIVFTKDPTLTVGLAAMGLAVASIWYVMGAEDRYLVSHYRGQIERAGELIQHHVWPVSDRAYIFVGHVPKRMPQGSPKLSGWRYDPISTTKMAAWIPLVLAIAWIVVLVVVGWPRTWSVLQSGATV